MKRRAFRLWKVSDWSKMVRFGGSNAPWNHTVVQYLYFVLPYAKWRTIQDNRTHYTNFLVASAANVPFDGPETYIFPASITGRVKAHLELEGSLKGVLDHDKAITGWMEAGNESS